MKRGAERRRHASIADMREEREGHREQRGGGRTLGCVEVEDHEQASPLRHNDLVLVVDAAHDLVGVTQELVLLVRPHQSLLWFE